MYDIAKLHRMNISSGFRAYALRGDLIARLRRLLCDQMRLFFA